MKILMLTPYLPYPPSAGGQVRSYNLIKQLSKHHKITLVCFTRDTNTDDQIKHMQQFCAKVLTFKRGKAWTLPNILRTGFSLYPFLIMIYFTPEMRHQLEEEIQTGNYDLIHAETFYVMPYLPKTNLPTVLVEQTIMSRVFEHQVKNYEEAWLRPLYMIDVLKMRYWEKYFWRKANRLVSVSEEDAKVIKSLTPGIQVDIVPNGVGEDFVSVPRNLHYNHTVFYLGNYKWMQNWEAAHILATQIFPLIKAKISDAKLKIVGQFPTAELKALRNQDINIVELADSDRHGVVESTVSSGILIAPIYGPSGTRLKILAAMASMLPVVTTPIGSEGLGAKNGESILIGKTPRDLANLAVKVLKNKSLYQKIALSARAHVDKNFTYEAISRKLESIYEEVVHHHS